MSLGTFKRKVKHTTNVIEKVESICNTDYGESPTKEDKPKSNRIVNNLETFLHGKSGADLRGRIWGMYPPTKTIIITI